MIPEQKNQNKEVYSTEEVIIGKWINGKPLYSKVIQMATPTVATDGVYPSNASYSMSSLNVEFCSIKEAYTTEGFPLPFISNTGRVIKCLYQKSTNTIDLTTDGKGLEKKPCYIRIIYTKTTD